VPSIRSFTPPAEAVGDTSASVASRDPSRPRAEVDHAGGLGHPGAVAQPVCFEGRVQAPFGSQPTIVATMLGRQPPKVEALLREGADDITAFASFPGGHWKESWSTRPVTYLRVVSPYWHERPRLVPGTLSLFGETLTY
jgi:hypothetical protein